MNKKSGLKFKSIYCKRKINYKWIIFITLATFCMAMLWEYSAQIFLKDRSILIATTVLFTIVFVGIFFDLLGIAVTAATEKPFHSMASQKIRGAKQSILLIRNAPSVGNFFNDVIGDVSSIVSGTAAVMILFKINQNVTISSTITSILLTATIASLTVGGKAIGKEIAMRKSNAIVFKLGCILSFFTKD